MQGLQRNNTTQHQKQPPIGTIPHAHLRPEEVRAEQRKRVELEAFRAGRAEVGLERLVAALVAPVGVAGDAQVGVLALAAVGQQGAVVRPVGVAAERAVLLVVEGALQLGLFARWNCTWGNGS